MDVSYVVLAIPAFFLLMGVEMVAARLLEKDYYRLNDSISDLSCGIIQQILEAFFKTFFFAAYVFVYERWRVATVPSDSVIGLLLCWLGVDFVYYWYHRLSHEVNAGWAAHIVHHQSEEYNLAVALRQSAFQGVYAWIFYLVLAVAGFAPLVFLSAVAFNTLYQFWIHTRTIGRLGPLEWVFNTPSHHRVHHARNPKYIDRNHGGTLIVWDRMFGTFAAEAEEPVYGITTPLASWNPLWANFHYWAELVRTARRIPRLSDRVRLFLKPPGWQPEELGGFVPAPEVDPATYRKFDTEIPRGLSAYVLSQFVALLLGASVFFFAQHRISSMGRAGGAALIVLSVVCLGGLLERKTWAFPLELLRLAMISAVGAAGGSQPTLTGGAAALVAVGSALWLWRYRIPSRAGTLAQPHAG
jgi:sterol desaturase/sphingolipid hydroxylase (fatty acid hydroxylase superfamily)